MKLIKHQPELSVFDNLFDSFFRDEPLYWMNRNSPSNNKVAVNIHEDEKAYNLEVLAPGFSKEELHIELENDLLKISAKKENKDEQKNLKYTRVEFRSRSFERSFRLPEGEIDVDALNANFKDGILFLSLPKLEKEEKEQRKMIEIH